MPTYPPSNLDGNQVLQYAFDDATQRLRTDTVVNTSIEGDVAVKIEATNDNIAIKSSTSGNELEPNADGSINIDSISGPIALPTGAATEVKQDVGNSSLSSINSNIDVTLSTRASETTLNNFYNRNHTDLQTIEGKQDIGNTSLASIDTKIDVSLSTRASETTLSAFKTANHSDLLTIESKQDTGNTSLSSINANQTNGTQKTQQVDGSGNVQPAGDTNAHGVHVIPGDGTNLQSYTASGEAKVLVTPLTSSSTVTVVQPTGTNLHTVVDSGTISVTQGTTPWTENITQFGGSNVVTGTGTSGAGIPRVTVSNDSNILATQSGTWNINNISGTISLPTGASTSANQTSGSQKTQIVDGSNATIGPSQTISGTNYLPVVLAASATPTAPVVTRSIQVAGSDGTNAQTLSTDSSGRLKLAGSSYFHPIFSLRVQVVSSATGGLATSLVIPISSTSTGNLIAVSVSSSVAGTVTVTDNLAQTYSTAISGTSGTHTSYIFYKANTASGVTSITISSTTNSGINAIVTEYFGISSSPLDKTSTGTVVGASAFSSGSTATTTSPVELLLGSAHGVTKNNQTYTAGTSWNSVGISNGFNAGAGQLFVEDQYVGVVGAYAATGTASGNDTIVANIATFIVTNTILTALNQPKVIKSGAGILKRIIVNSIGTGSPTLTIYDNTTNSGTTIAIISLLNAVGSLEYNLNFTTGLTIVINSSTADFTIVYD